MKNLFPICVLFILITTQLNSNAQKQHFFLKNKNYYANFNATETQHLDNAFNLKSHSDKNFIKYEKFQTKADNYFRQSKMPLSEKQTNKAIKKYKKYSEKAAKYKIKAINTFLTANSQIKPIYSQKINSLQLNHDSCLFAKIKIKSEKFQDSAKFANTKTANDKTTKANNLDENYYYDNLNILYLEYQLAILNNDKKIISELNKKFCANENKQTKINNDSSKNDVKKTQPDKKITENKIKYLPQNDSLIFYSNNPKIDLKIKYTSEEYTKLANYINLAKIGYAETQKNIPLTDSLKKIDSEISQTMDFLERNKLSNKKTPIEQQIETNKINAITNYNLANKNYFTTRNTHINDFVNNKTNTTTTNYKNYIKNKKTAIILYNNADTLLTNSIGKNNNEKLDLLTKANQQIITALKFQETAFEAILNFNKNIKTSDTTKKQQKTEKKTSKKQQKTKKNPTKKKTQKNTKKNNKQTTKAKISGLFSYSYTLPTPEKDYTPMGTIYRVQVGISKYLLPVNELKNFDKIYYETNTKDNNKRFLVGNYTQITKAETTLNNLKSKGYKTAFIVKYIDGKRTDAIYSTTISTAKTNKNNKYATTTNVAKTKYLLYLIQIGTFSNQKTSKELNISGKLYIKHLENGKIQYFTGPFYRYSEATHKLPAIKQKGYNDAVIVAFNNGKKTSISKGKKIEQSVQATNQITYRIQVGAYSDYLSTDKLNKQFGSLEKLTIHTHIHNELIIYSVGNAKTLSEARTIREKVVKLGFSKSFIIAIKGNKQIPLGNTND